MTDTTMGRLSLWGGLGLGVVSIFCPYVFHDIPKWLGYLGFGLGTGITLYGIVPPNLHPGVLIGSKWLPLPQAMTRLYESTRGSIVASFAEGLTKTSEDLLQWYAYWATMRGLPVYGKRPPSTVLEPIPEHELVNISFRDSGNVAFAPGTSDRPRYIDVSVKRSEFLRRLKSLKAQAKNSPIPRE